MKLYVTVNRPIPNSYIGVDLATQKIDFSNLDPLCERSQCVDLILDNVLSYINIGQIAQVLEAFITRLRKGGKLTIIDVELNTTLKLYLNGQINLLDINAIMFGDQRINKCSICSYKDVQALLVQRGLNIISINLNHQLFTLIAQRP